jgi:hypothetical protein
MGALKHTPRSERLTHLKLFRAIVLFTAAMLGLAVLLALWPGENERIQDIIKMCSHGCCLGFGALLTSFAARRQGPRVPPTS